MHVQRTPAMLRPVLFSFLAVSLAGPLVRAEPAQKSSEQAVASGLAYLRKTQKPNGSWSDYPAMTGLAVQAFLHNGRTEKNEPAVAKGIQFILKSVKPNGAICIPGNPATAMPSYNTSLCLVALVLTKNPAYKTAISNARAYLEKSQFSEDEGIQRDNPMYGGIGYGDDPGDETHPDLSNLSTAIDALHAAGVKPTAPSLRKALVYLGRVQNRRESNDQPWVKEGPNDGGFLYEPQGSTKTAGGKHESYGAMTYAGIRCLLACGVPKTDPKVQAAWKWIQNHYTFAEHPGMGTASVYYYYRTAAISLDAFGQKTITDKSGKPHVWAKELAGQLIPRQRPDGSWVNKNSRYWENRPELVTSFSLITLAYCRKNAG